MAADKLRVGIVGGTGYTGVELLRLLVQHGGVEIAVITSRSEEGMPVADMFPSLRGKLDIAFSSPDESVLGGCDVVFFATPNGTAMTMARSLLERDTRIIDLAADFRLKSAAQWEKWYGMPHACPELLEEAVYGLPEVNREKISSARVLANPGCYPTAVQLGLLPLIESGLAERSGIIADCKSGVSGAGRKAAVGFLYCEATDSFKAYNVPAHRHLPEITQGLTTVCGETVSLVFVPHLTPMIRGIHATLYATVRARDVDLQALYANRFANEAFVDVLPAGSHPETRSVRGSNMCRVAVHRPQGGDTVVVLSIIDNLVKGAAGQAVQNMNIMFGFDEDRGLAQAPLFP